MNLNDSKQTNPLQNLFIDVKKILDFIEIKDNKQAMDNETTESRNMAEIWMNAKIHNDTYVTYKQWWTFPMFKEIQNNIKLSEVNFYIKYPYNVPLSFQEHLLEKGRERFLELYEEQNNYYRMINGLPPYKIDKSEFIYLSPELQQKFHVSADTPVHLLSEYNQNQYISTSDYQSVLENNPDKLYLKYLGRYKIGIYEARNAKDFDIIRYPLNSIDINPNLLNIFASLYADYREYVMVVLYNSNFEDLYTNYRTFMGVIIMSFTLLQIGNKALELANGNVFLDDTILHIILSMYGIPESLLLTNEVRRNLANNILKLVREKGTNEVYYDLIQILGYQDVVISKLLLMKGQQFDSNNNYKVITDSDVEYNNNLADDDPDKKNEIYSIKPYFLQIDLKDKNPYKTITDGNAPIHTYESIITNDPTWWDFSDTKKVLHDSIYSSSDSKYIMIEAVINQMKYMFESIYFTRMILDNKNSTDEFLIEIPEIFGTQMVSVYDIIIFIICATCMNNGLNGTIITETDKLLATCGFNFDININTFTEFLNTTRYVDKSKILEYLEKISISDKSDINRLFNDIMYPLREWLETKIVSSDNRHEYLEYESIYKALFTYDITRNQFLDDFQTPIQIITEKYNLTENDMLALQHFYPRTISGKAVTIDEYNQSVNSSRYRYPFLTYNYHITWNIHIVIETPYGDDDRGYLYFHDILNCNDLRELTNPDGTRIFMDYESNEEGWVINQQAVDKVLYLINSLDENELQYAFFQIRTPVLNSDGFAFEENEKLPANIRTGIFKSILYDKIVMDMQGLAVPPVTYFEYLYRKNPSLYNLLIDDDRFNLNKDAWMNDIMTIVLALETELNMHMKYFEQSIIGESLFFKPLITLIKHFKSTMVDFAKTGLKYIFSDKIDSGGNSNMIRLFDEASFIINFIASTGKGYDAKFGLFDAEFKMVHYIHLYDRLELFRMISGHGFAASVIEKEMGSVHLTDDMIFYVNGKLLESTTADHTVNEYHRIHQSLVDLESWSDYVKSYNPD